MLGARTWQTARHITVPLALPTLLAGALVAFLQALNLFGSPAILAIPAGFHTLTTRIWSLFQFPPKPELAAAASLPLLLLTILLLRGQALALGPARLCRAGRQVRRAAPGAAGRLAASGGGAGARGARHAAVPALRGAVQLGLLARRLAPGHARHHHAAQCALHLPRAQLDHAGAQEHLPARHAVGDAGRAAGAADRLHRRPPRRDRTPRARLPRHRAACHPRHRAGRRPVPRLHAPAAHALRHAVDPADRLHHHRTAGGLPAALLGLPRRASRARRGRPHAGRLAPAHTGRHHRAAAALGGDRHLVLRLRRGDPRAVGRGDPLHLGDQGAVGPDLRPQGKRRHRRHRRLEPDHGGHHHPRRGGRQPLRRRPRGRPPACAHARGRIS